MADDGDALCQLLDEELGYDATTPSNLTNHLPMALVALERLGADDHRLREFATRYERRLGPLTPSSREVTNRRQWRDSRGVRAAYGPLRDYLDDEVRALGQDGALRRYLPELLDGCGGAAFHGVIRLAYALESRSDARVAAGLAYLTAVHQPLGEPTGTTARTDDPAEALAWLAGRAALVGARREGNIGERMAQVAAHPEFAGVVDWLAVDERTPRRLSAAAVALYAATDDFVALHGVTASHALSRLAPYAEDRDALSRWWFQALAAAYVTIGSPSLERSGEAVAPWGATPQWDLAADAAVGSDDEHVIKLVYSARELDAEGISPLLFGCAARQAGLPAEAQPGGR